MLITVARVSSPFALPVKVASINRECCYIDVVAAPRSNLAMTVTDNWKFPSFKAPKSGIQIKGMSMVSIISCSDISLAEYKNDNSSCNSKLAT